MSERKPPKEAFVQWYGDPEFQETPNIPPPEGANIMWQDEQIYDNDIRYIREDLVMVGWQCQNLLCGDVLFGPNKPTTCWCGGDLVLATEE